MEILLFDSGMAMLNTLPSGEWQIGSAGAGLMGGLRYHAYIIGIGNNDSPSNGILVRPDSPILKTKGANPDFPNVYGSVADIKGKTLLTTTISSAHYVAARWLKTQGLLDKDITIKNMDASQVLSAFENNIGDMISLWTPFLFMGIDKGWKLVADGEDLKTGIGTWLMCDKKYGDKNPEMVAKALRAFLRGVDFMKNEAPSNVVGMFKRYLLDYCGMEMNDELLPKIIKACPVLDANEQLVLFDTSKGESTAQKWLAGYAQFMTDADRISHKELDSIKGMKFATDKFLKLAAQPVAK